VFSRGHLRRYAELLGLSVDDMLAHLARQETGEPPLPDLTKVPRVESQPMDWRALRPAAVGAAAVAVFALAIWLVLTRTPSADDPPSVTTASTAVSPTPASPGTASSTPVASPSATELAPVPAATAAVIAETTSESRGPARPTVISQRGDFSLAMSVDEECWIEIYDKDGDALFYDMAQPDRRIQVSGSAPVRVRLGFAPAVTLEFLGRRMPVPAELIRQSLAHFTLSADGRFTRYRPPPPTRSPSETRASGT
jgi:cytoskeleton protein RodZ